MRRGRGVQSKVSVPTRHVLPIAPILATVAFEAIVRSAVERTHNLAIRRSTERDGELARGVASLEGGSCGVII